MPGGDQVAPIFLMLADILFIFAGFGRFLVILVHFHRGAVFTGFPCYYFFSDF